MDRAGGAGGDLGLAVRRDVPVAQREGREDERVGRALRRDAPRAQGAGVGTEQYPGPLASAVAALTSASVASACGTTTVYPSKARRLPKRA